MPSKVICFWVEPTELVQVTFRRYVTTGPVCNRIVTPYEGAQPTTWGYHDAEVPIEVRAKRPDDAGHDADDDERTDARWPTKCPCGYVFPPDVICRVHVRTLYRSPQRAGQWTLHDVPAGAMWDAPWLKGHDGAHPKPDNLYLVLRTPFFDWTIDGPSSNGNRAGWTRTGRPPLVTVNPSIGYGEPQKMHGWLRNGVLEVDLP